MTINELQQSYASHPQIEGVLHALAEQSIKHIYCGCPDDFYFKRYGRGGLFLS